MLYKNIKPTSKIILLFTILLLPSFAFAEADTLATQLREKFERNDITGAKKLLAKGLQNKYFLLVDCEDQDVDSVEIQIQAWVNNQVQILRIHRESLPYLSIQDTVNEYIELAFTLIKDNRRTAIRNTYKPSTCSRSHLAYLLLQSDGTIGLEYCLELPAPPDTVIVKVHVPPDTIIIRPPKFFNYRVLSSGGIALGSFIWFLREKVKANDDFDKYESAVSTPEAVKLRHEVEKSRTRRDIAGAISLVSGLAFSYLFVRDLFRSESEENLKNGIKSVDSTSKITFGLEPNP